MGDYDADGVTKKQLDFLELRRKLKEHYRKQFKQETCTSAPLDPSSKPKDDNFGSFFGPSEPTIIPRVIQETTALLHDEVLRMSNPRLAEKKAVNKNQTSAAVVKRMKSDLVKLKLQKLKEARDYSFLSSDDAKPSTHKKVPAPKPEVLKKTKPVSSNGKLQCTIPLDTKADSTTIRQKPVSSNGKLQCTIPHDTKADSTTIRQKPISSCHGNSNKADGHERQTASKTLVSKMGTDSLKKTVTVRKALKQEVSKSAKPQTSRPINKPITIPVPSQKSSQDRHKKSPLIRRQTEEEEEDDDDDDGFDYIGEIRNIFGYNPNKYRDDHDTKNMEAGFHDIQKEERRSALIARKEDQIEQKRIEDEARKERLMKNAKRQKLSQS